jgi:intein/homing endonuclease
MCLTTVVKNGKITDNCKKGVQGKYLIGYKVVRKNNCHDGSPILSAYKCVDIFAGLNIANGYSQNTTIEAENGMFYQNGLHIFASKLSAEKDIKYYWNLRMLNPDLRISIIPVHFYKKHIVAEGTEEFERQKGDKVSQKVVVVSQYFIKKEDYNKVVKKFKES